MNARFVWVSIVAVPLLVCGRAAADPPASAALAKKIDLALAGGWAAAGIEPAPGADDAEFMRRVYLDLVGRIPSVNEVRSFLADKRADRRQRLVDQLLGSPRYVAHFTSLYRALLIPEASNNFLVRAQAPSFEGWLKKQVAANIGYDRMAHDLVAAPLGSQGFEALLGGAGDASTLAFFSAKEFKPESLAASTARIFLGVSVECAQCHNHPFADWKREQFWSFAAFFAGMQSQRVQDFLLPGRELPEKNSLTIPGTETVVQARFLDNTAPVWKGKHSTRATLADWLTAPDNPYFRREAVNRTWAYFLGAGLVEPVDDLVDGHGSPGHAELLEMLGKEFAASRFDMKYLIRVITATDAYQRSSAGGTIPAAKHEGPTDPAQFARAALRGLTAEQLFDSLAMATGYRDSGASGDDLLSAVVGGNTSARAKFLTKFANQSQRATQAQTSILQALALMNGKVVANATSLENSETLAAVIDAPFLGTPGRIETLYLATLSRRPTTREADRAVRFVDDAIRNAQNQDTATAYSAALADVFWALLNSSEFTLNH